MPLHRRQVVVAAKIETTPGTAIATAAADAVFFLADVGLPEVTAEEIDRYAPGSASPAKSIIGARRVMFTLRAEMHGLGSSGSPGWASILLPACGLYASTTTDWKLITAAPAASGNVPRTITVAVYVAGLRFVACGCMGNAKLIFENGRAPIIECELTGKLSAVADVPNIGVTLPTVTPPRCSNMTLSWNAKLPKTSRVEVDLQNEVYLREDISSAAGESGYAYAMITGRRPIITMEPEMELAADLDVYNSWLAGTTGAAAIAVGGATWNKIEIAAPAAQIITPTLGDRDGVLTNPHQLLCTRSAADDDELTITFTAGA